MELLRDLLANVIMNEKFEISCINWDTNRLITASHDRAVLTLNRIRKALADGRLCDAECIEEIVCILENSGISCGSRHDF